MGETDDGEGSPAPPLALYRGMYCPASAAAPLVLTEGELVTRALASESASNACVCRMVPDFVGMGTRLLKISAL